MTARPAHAAPALIAPLAAAGAAISAYLTWVHAADRPVVCGGLGSCATVQSSEYATLGGIPVALFGLALYATIGVLALLALREPRLLLPLFALALSGLLYSGYLTWVELAVLGAICLWCVVSALIIAAIATLAAWAVLTPAPVAAQPASRRGAA